MNKILYSLACFCFLGLTFLHSQDLTQVDRAKIIYVKITDSSAYSRHSFYVGQTIKVTYNLLLFSNARFVGTEFVGGIDRSELSLKNPNTKWKLSNDGSYSAVYEYKINSIRAVIPPLKVIAVSSDGDYTDSSVAPAIHLNIIDLNQNKKYAGVVADEFRILGYKAKTYDSLNNILVFEAEAKNSNLENLKLPNNFKQGFESIHTGLDSSDGIYYCIIPKNIQSISFEYFSLTENHFKDISLPVVPVDDVVSTQDDIKPKNNFLIFSNLVLIVLIVVLLIAYFVFHRRKIFLVIFVLLLIYLLWNVFSTHQGILLANAHIRILPTYNSTILETTKTNVEVEIIGKHGQYYKIMTDDDAIGWVKKDDVR